MSQTLTLEISGALFEAMESQAKSSGVELRQLVAALLEQRFVQKPDLVADKTIEEAARSRFEKHFGTLAVENRLSANNEGIDTDLAREYASNHE